MTHVDENGKLWIIAEPPGRCELCGAVKATRPYGPNGEQVCFPCGMKNEAAAKARFAALQTGDGEAYVDAPGRGSSD